MFVCLFTKDSQTHCLIRSSLEPALQEKRQMGPEITLSSQSQRQHSLSSKKAVKMCHLEVRVPTPALLLGRPVPGANHFNPVSTCTTGLHAPHIKHAGRGGLLLSSPLPSASCGLEQATYLLEDQAPSPENWTNSACSLPWVTYKNKKECE